MTISQTNNAAGTTSATEAPAGRAQFSSRFGFLMAAAGAAVGLGNVWSFPSMAANNGGGAFLLVYVVMAFILAYPALMAELTLGRYAQSGVINAMGLLGGKGAPRRAGQLIGFGAICAATLGLTFYAIVTGWLISHALEPMAQALGLSSVEAWLTEGGMGRDWWLALATMGVTISVVLLGVNRGIERWTKRLMPLLIATMLVLIVITLTFDGAMEGLGVYLLPDFSRVNAQLMLDAMGQAFFSLSIGIGAMVVYGSYLSRQANLPRVGAQVMCIDMGVAFIAGLLIIPALYVAQGVGVEVMNEQGELTSSATLLFDVMPAMFARLGVMGAVMEVLFFGLLAIAALTSMFPALEVPVSTLEETGSLSRRSSAVLIGAVAFAGSTLILFNFDRLFGLVIDVTINSMPVIGALVCLYVGWLLSRNAKLQELRQGAPEIERTLFWKLWPWYIRLVCPLLILVVMLRG
ncbi:sodium-dependent transporter [Halomonas pacifica]|uniref:Sodium-dependent transporter n=1 Tax=Bisbaumannia pacifica TaxID=77098 RepID=A0A510XB06_9GAMM|nr:sodium-dependent transporter [Halomonas pacifica]MBH8579353.1 sodium-dependent transporter [Halomonas pacifica]MDC8802959.1 sodium-dependent transporter [Halomonas pacifica]GEK45770.1 sodium-dependent transporter [Halomonas pacifica]